MLLGFSVFVVACDGDDGSLQREGDGDRKGEVGAEVGVGDEPDACAAIETAADCIAELGCAPVFGHELLEAGDAIWCTDATEQFIGCVTTLDLCSVSGKTPCEDPCPVVAKTLCDGDSYWRTAGCALDSLETCEVPGEISGDC